LLNQIGKKTPENQSDPELRPIGESGLRFRGKRTNGGATIDDGTGGRG
jgi:hypothetical protein